MKTPLEEFEKSIELGYKRLGIEYTPERPDNLSDEYYQSHELLKLGRALKANVLSEEKCAMAQKENNYEG